MNWRDGLTDEQIREAEMLRGAEVAGVKHGAAREALAARFDPDYKPRLPTEYNRRLAEQNKGRWEANHK